MPPLKIPAVFMRGGTSKGIIFNARDLPSDIVLRDRILLGALGSPDPYRRQIDGLGGATSSSSKAVVISKSQREDCDVDYLVGQVDIAEPVVDYSSNCGNLSAAVGPYAINTGLVAANGDVTEVRIFQVNTNRRIIARVPTRGGLVVEDGDYRIDGIARSGARVDLRFLDPGGGGTGRLFPTGNVTDTVNVPGHGPITVTIIDAGLIAAFVKAPDLGLSGTELKPAIDPDEKILKLLEAIRGEVAVLLGMSPDASSASRCAPILPRIAFVAPPQDYLAAGGRNISGKDIDVVARAISGGVLHHAYEVTGAIATAAAAAIPGTIVNQVGNFSPAASREVRIGHTSGTISVGIDLSKRDGAWHVDCATLGRTARTIMEGVVYLPAST
jgi:2-methylaconitate cis-trans-isomerase PrpF